MKHPLSAFILLCAFLLSTAAAQEKLPVREYTNPDERISMSGETKFNQAMDIFTDMFKRYGGKVLIYEGKDEKPININVPHMYWRDAFELVLRVNNYWYDERENYVRVISMGTAPLIDTLLLRSQAAKGIREVEIAATFFEVNITDLKQLGIDWSVLNLSPSDNPTTRIGVGTYSGNTPTNAISVNDGGLNSSLSTVFKAANISAALRAIVSNNLGEVISSPSITVRSKEKGRIQVGSDISVKQKDFAGNLLEQFFSTGTIIEVTPTVMTADSTDFIHLAVEAERSSVTPDPNRTIIDRTKATTSVLLLDGEETVVGGLYINQNNTVRRGIPFLKDLPWWVFGIRYLAGYDENQVVKKELVILLKAHLVPSLEQRVASRLLEKEQHVLQNKLQSNEQLMRKLRAEIDAQK